MRQISVALATRNGAKFIDEQLASFASQTMLPSELVVSDDGSEDDTVDRVQAFAQRVPFDVEVYCNPRPLGVARNFAQAIEHCRGDITFLSDQDDVWLPHKIETMAQLFEADPNLLVAIHDLALADDHLRPAGVTKLQRIHRFGIARSQYITGAATAFRREILDLVLPFPNLDITHDAWIHLIAESLERRLVCDSVLQLYRRHPQTTSDWIASASSFSEVLRSSRNGLHGPPGAITGDADHVLDEVRKRVHSIASSDSALVGPLSTTAVDTFLDQRRHSLEVRRSIREANGIKRIVRTARAYRAGHYAEFAGWLSAVKDALQGFQRNR